MSRFLLSLTFCSVMFSTSSLLAAEAKHDLPGSLHDMTFPNLRGFLDVSNHHGSYIDLSGLGLLLAPYALVFDVFGLAKGAVITPIQATRFLIYQIKAAKRPPGQEVVKQVLAGLDQRLQQLQQFTELGEYYSEEEKLVLLLALTAWDSRDLAPRALNEKQLAKLAPAIREDARQVFNLLTNFSEQLQKQFDNQKYFMSILTGQIELNIQTEESVYNKLKNIAVLLKSLIAKVSI